MNFNSFRGVQLNLSNLRPWVALLLGIWLMLTIGLGWLVKSLLILIGLILVVPLLALVGVNWWLKRNLIEDRCPVCHYDFAAINGAEVRCPNCTELLVIEKGHFHRLAPPGTVDVEAIEVTAQQVED